MSANKTAAILECILPRDPAVPHDMASLHVLATLSFCPSRSAERRARVDHIAALISDALAPNATA